ncbi:Gfo/Idh/MocA family protein [Variovorax sp. KK3]|uniref:Gfo/Idh/MocA family protein n=1 Tax=Variovorax sp. KK3 TaxID=1855728 RepID=UPI00097C0719|nr:Gfo/Idh/MocA family oxidoreductase [Variovorax sp. KK3]
MTNTEPLNVAIVGLGWWGRIIADHIRASTRMRLVRATDVDERARGFATDRGLAFGTSFDEVLADPMVRGVVICTPHSQHTAQIVAAANAGKHVFCEKPLSLTSSDAARALAAVEAAGVTLAVGHEKRFEPPVMELLRLCRTGALGVPLQVEANFSQDKFLAMPSDNWRLSAKEAPAGPMTATGIHLLDLSVAIFGEARSVHASVQQLDSPLTNGDTLAVLVSFERGGHALLSAILATPYTGRFAVYGSRGWAEVRDKSHPESPQGWTLTTCMRGELPKAVDMPPAPAVLHNLEAFADAARGGAAYPVPREQMVANVCALEAAFRSAETGRVEPVTRVDSLIAR